MESVRPRLIAILNRIAASAEDHVVFAEQATLDEIRLVAQLIDDGYLAGKYIPAGVKHRFVNRAKKPAVTFNVYSPPAYPAD